MSDFLIGIYKEIGKQPKIVKIKNEKKEIEELLNGEFINIDYDDYTLIYKKNSEKLLPNIYVDQYSKIGVSLKGTVFAVGKDNEGNFISLTREQAQKCISFFIRGAFNYENFDKHGRYVPRSKRNNKRIEKSENSIQNVMQNYDKQTLIFILKVTSTILELTKNALDNLN